MFISLLFLIPLFPTFLIQSPNQIGEKIALVGEYYTDRASIIVNEHQ